MATDHELTLADLDDRLWTMLPEEYQDSYEEVEPVSMGSAGLRFAPDGTVAWDKMWDTFCDLAMAGGPPHKGMLLEPAPLPEIEADSARYKRVVEEIVRGVQMVTELDVYPSPARGWVRVKCHGDAMAEWLVRAIVMENVAARREGRYLDLPAGPAFRIEKEIKNVVTVIAKTSHYWLGHMPRLQHEAIRDLFRDLEARSPLVGPPDSRDAVTEESCRMAAAEIATRMESRLGLRRSDRGTPGWLGLECGSVKAAIWLMRALVVSNVLARREDTALLVPVNPPTDPGGDRVVAAAVAVHRLAVARGVL